VIYREFRPSAALRSVVDRLWWLEGPADALGAEPIPPDGHAEIIVHGGDPFVEHRDDGTTHVQDRVLLAGQITRAVRVTPRGFARVVGVRLRPDGAHAVCGVPQHELTDRIVDLRDVHALLARRLRDDVLAHDSAETMIASLERTLCDAIAPPPSISAVRVAIAYAHERRGLVRVPALADHVGLSVRQLERLFVERVGLAPKLYLRILRFQAVLRTLRRQGGPTVWADLAVAHGYYDQAHFIRDFKVFVGRAPSACQITDDSLTALFSAIRRR
jgi:AraC-like DNA-binding protein